MPVPEGVLLTVVSLAAGWVCLLPLRLRLGWGYHLAAYPTGLMLWPLVAAIVSLFGRPFGPKMVLGTYAVLVVLVAAVALVAAGRDRSDGRAAAPWTFGAWAALLVGASTAISLTGWTSAAYDSLFHYESWGTWLLRTGDISVEIIGDYGAFIPAVHAADSLLGAAWTSVPYPVLSIHVLAVTGAAIFGWSRPRLGRAAATAVAAAAVASMGVISPYVHHTLYVHSHMITATYLLLAIWAVQRAYLGSGDIGAPEGARVATSAWLLVAGLAAAGFALTRTDGIAYVIVPIVVAALLRIETGGARRPYALFLAAVALPIAVVYGSAFYDLGVWEGRKLTGTRAAATLAMLGAVMLLTLLVDRVPRLRTLLADQRKGVLVVGILNVLAVLGLALARPEGFAEAGRNMVINLFSTGGYRLLWYFAAGVLALPLLWRYRWPAGRWPTYLLLAIGQFFVVAVLVHGSAHPGRLSPADSFARVSFHAVPLVFWYAGLVATTLIHRLRSQGTTSRCGAIAHPPEGNGCC